MTGATGYVGGRLVPRLLAAGWDVHVLVRDAGRLAQRPWSDDVTVHVGDLMAPETLEQLPTFAVAYYLVHGMTGNKDFEDRDAVAARNFAAVRRAHTVYLGGLQPVGEAASHLRSRAEVGAILAEQGPCTEFRAGPVIGSGSASFEMVRYLTERLPVMVTPRWVGNRIRPVAIRDVLAYLVAAADKRPVGILDVGADVVRFADLMQAYAQARGLRRRALLPTPVLAPKLAARWVQFVTPVPNTLAIPIIEGMREDLVGDPAEARRLFADIEPTPLAEALRLAVGRTDADDVETRWGGAAPSATYQVVDEENLVQEIRTAYADAAPEAVFVVLLRMGGENGWPAMDWAWRLRGAMDRAVGGPGLRRGRRSRSTLRPGDELDFWRVEAVEAPTRLRLRAEMKLPGTAWLEFTIEPLGDGSRITQTASFEPRGLPGLLYWKSLYPVHRVLFRRMVRNIARAAEAGEAQPVQGAARSP